MWLINTKTLKLEYFLESKLPKYAILSHTWGDEELSFQELIEESTKGTTKAKKGYHKIEKTCMKAQKRDLGYAWVDTCCIDKSSSAELTESINSMYTWYQRAEACFVYLSDLPTEAVVQDHLAACRWFTRGWTLQELIAPSGVRFYNQGWIRVGDKISLSQEISSITGIPTRVLEKGFVMHDYSIAQRMFWAARRETTRTEDLAYCLLGIFDVHMPLIYGEGPKSFRRLQDAIIARGNDMTIFAWDHVVKIEDENAQEGAKGKDEGYLDQKWNLFSPSPTGFANCSQTKQFSRTWFNPEFAITNKGMRFPDFKCMYLYDMRSEDESNAPKRMKYLMPLGSSPKDADGKRIHYAVPLQKIGPNIFHRDGKVFSEDPATSFDVLSKSKQLRFVNDFHIQVDARDYHRFLSASTSNIHFPDHDSVEIKEAIPYTLWDEPKRVLLLDSVLSQYSYLLAAVLCDVHLGTTPFEVMVCIWGNEEALTCSIFETQKHEDHSSWVTRHMRHGHQATWDGFDDNLPDKLRDHISSIWIAHNDTMFTVSIRLEKDVKTSEQTIGRDCVAFDIKEVGKQAFTKDQGTQTQLDEGKNGSVECLEPNAKRARTF